VEIDNDFRVADAVDYKFITDLEKQDSLISEFNSELWCSLVDFMAVYSEDDVRITFKNGVTVEV
jgi:hypothetical protein